MVFSVVLGILRESAFLSKTVCFRTRWVLFWGFLVALLVLLKHTVLKGAVSEKKRTIVSFKEKKTAFISQSKRKKNSRNSLLFFEPHGFLWFVPRKRLFSLKEKTHPRGSCGSFLSPLFRKRLFSNNFSLNTVRFRKSAGFLKKRCRFRKHLFSNSFSSSGVLLFCSSF